MGALLGIRGKRVLLTVHIVLNAVWIGGLAAILFLNGVKGSSLTGEELSAIDATIFRLHDTIVINVAFGVILTGLLFSMFTKWAFFDFYWIVVKWLSIVVLFLLIVFFLTPAINGMAAVSDVARAAALDDLQYLGYARRVGVVTTTILVILVTVVAISVFKPWGKRKHPFSVSHKTTLIVGGVVGATVAVVGSLQFAQLQRYRRMPIEHVPITGIANGTYAGEARCDITYGVEVAVADHRIEDVRITMNRQTFYARLAEGVAAKIIRAQRIDVEAVTGATTTSKCLMKAAEHALVAREPRGDR